MILLGACDKDEDKTILRIGEVSTLSASTHSVVMQNDLADDNAVAFTWTEADFGYPASTTYTLQLALNEEGFSQPVSDEIGTAILRQEYTVAEFNALATQLGIPAGTEQDVLVRIQAMVARTDKASYSKPVTIKVTPYVAESPYATLYLVGDATEADWNLGQAVPMFRDEANPFVYIFTGNFKAGSLKIMATTTVWAPQWGGANGTLVFRETDADPDPASINVAAAGYYTLKVDLQFNTYTLTPYDASSAVTYTAIGVTGDFDGWAIANPMTSTALNPHIWSGTYTLAPDWMVKFATPGWAAKWGLTSDWKPLYGRTTQGNDANFSIEVAGTCRVIFNDLDGRYTVIKN